MKIADVSIRRPVFAAVLIITLMVLGLFSYKRIGVDLFPNVDFPVVTVTAIYPGADPASMESKIADPIEEAVNTMAGIKTLRSVSLESVAQVIVAFDLDIEVDQATQDIRDRISAIAADLPEGMEPPKVQKLDVGSSPIMSVALSGELPARELTKLADDVVKERIQRLRGVGNVDLVGGRGREIHVVVDPARLAGLNLTVEDVTNALRAQNLELPAGRVTEGKRELTVKTKGEVRTVDDLANIIIGNINGAVVRIGTVAKVVDGTEEARSWSSIDGTSAVALVIRKQAGSNTVAVAEAVKAELAALKPQLDKAGARLSIPSDWSGYIAHSIDDVKFDLVFGAILAIVIILFFLHDFRATFISALAIPSSVVATFWFVDVMGFTFNQMTMLGLSLSIGILIDDAIVVIENIYRHRAMGKGAMQAARDATAEIGLAVIATTAAIMAVFLPVAFMKGIIGRFFFQFGLTVSFAVAVSLLVSFTLTPMLASRMLKPGHHIAAPFRPVARFLDRVDRVYHRVLGWALGHRWKVVGLSMLTLVGSCAIGLTQIKGEFISPEDRAEFQVKLDLPVGSSLLLTREYAETVADDLRKHAPGVTSTFVTVGGGDQGQVNQAVVSVQMTKAKGRGFHQEDAMAWIRARFADVKDVNISVTPINAVGGSAFRDQAIQFNIRGSDMDKLIDAATRLAAELKKTEGFVDVDLTYRGGRPELGVEVDRDRAAALGVPVASVATTLRALVAGDKVSEFKDGLDIYDVTIQMSEQEKAGIAGLANLKVRSQTGQLVDLSNVVTAEKGEAPSSIERQARQRQITVLANLQGMPLGDGAAKVTELAKTIVPPELTTDFEGMAQVMQESAGYMVVALVLAIIFVFLLLSAQFNSFMHALTIMVSLVFAFVGGILALFAAGMTINIFSGIGFIMLMGLVVKNAILLVDYTNTLREEKGLGIHDALLAAGPVRLRPILMTTAAMVFGMLPVALALSEGGETRAPMAVTVIGGLLTSMFLTLVVVPVFYSLMSGLASSRFVRWLADKIFVRDAGEAELPSARAH